jgi:hypothetical protein
MKLKAQLALIAMAGLAGSVVAQTPGATGATQPSQSTPSSQSAVPSRTAAAQHARPETRYPIPAAQDGPSDKAQAQDSQTGDSQSNPSNHRHKKLPKKTTASSATSNGTVEQRGTRSSDQAKPSQDTAKHKYYKGNTGKKPDAGTACSTARPTPNGGVDCGTGGNGATPGNVPK